MTPRFIAIEGPDYSGKTTLTTLLHDALKSRGEKCVKLHDPGNTELGMHMRPFLKDPERKPMHVVAEVLAFNAIKHEMYSKLVLPALQDDHWVLTDRYTMSTWVYQGFTRGANMAAFSKLMQDTAPPEPDLYIVLLVNKEAAKSRADSRGGEADFFEKNERQQSAVRMAYMRPTLWTAADVLCIDTSTLTQEEALEYVLQKLDSDSSHEQPS